jgi:hypothetical protein
MTSLSYTNPLWGQTFFGFPALLPFGGIPFQGPRANSGLTGRTGRGHSLPTPRFWEKKRPSPEDCRKREGEVHRRKKSVEAKMIDGVDSIFEQF